MPAAVKKPFLRRRWVRATIILLVLFCGLLALPFLFTTTLVRMALRNSSFDRFSPTLHHASLSPSGTLSVTGLTLHEIAPREKLPLLHVGRGEIRFFWRELLSNRVREITASDVKVHLRPGADEGSSRPSSLTLMQLFESPANASAPTAPSTPAAAGSSFRYDAIRCAGVVTADPFPSASIPAITAPFHLVSTMASSVGPVGKEFDVTIGDARGGGMLTLSAQVLPQSNGSVLSLSRCHLQQMIATLPAPAILAERITGNATITLGSIDLTGTLGFIAGSPPAADLSLAVRELSVDSALDAAKAFHLHRLGLLAHGTGPLDASFLRTGLLRDTVLSFDDLSTGKNEITQAAASLSLRDGLLESPDVHFTLAKGSCTGGVRFRLADKRLESATLAVKGLDQKELAKNIAPDKLDAEGTSSGTIRLGSDPSGTWTGSIELTADGPGKLKIKDQAAAEALAGKLGSGAATGVLPANFSTIVVQQLKDYPYITGHIQVEAPDGIPAVTLNYARDPIKPGEAGYGIQTTVAGQKVLANYTIQLPELTIVLQGKTIAELLALATGFEKQVAGAAPTK